MPYGLDEELAELSLESLPSGCVDEALDPAPMSVAEGSYNALGITYLPVYTNRCSRSQPRAAEAQLCKRLGGMTR